MTGLVTAIFIPIVLLLCTGPLMARLFRARRDEDVVSDFIPTVMVVTPMFNEGEGIRRTIRSVLAQDYPADRIELIVVDDCSTDDSYQHAVDEARGHCAGGAQIRVLRNEVNRGKRGSINRAVGETSAEIVVSVDSDVELAPDAVRHLVRRFTSPRIAAVGGRVDIRNKRHGWLTAMQTVKYFFGYQVLKSLERTFRSVMCLSGCLTAYRRAVLIELAPILESRNILGVPIKYGEDRFLTRQIVKAGYQTTMTLDAVCSTDAATSLSDYFAQQIRWRRSNIVDYFGGLSHVWRIHPVVAVHFYSLFLIFLSYPVLLAYALAVGAFWPLMTAHLCVVAVLGVVYRVLTRGMPAEQRVSAAAILPMAIMLPVTYGILATVALLTLDSRAWETRGHAASEEATEPVLHPTPAPAVRVRRAHVVDDASASSSLNAIGVSEPLQ